MRYELETLEEYSEETLLAELRRVAEALCGQRLTVTAFNNLARVHASTLQKRFGSWRAALDRAGISEELAPRAKSITRVKLLDAVRSFSDSHSGRSPTVAEISKVLGIYRTTISNKFGSGGWASILAEAGLRQVPLGRRYSDEQCFDNLLDLWAHYGRQPRYPELNQPPSRVGSKAYVRRWGGWRKALAAFVRAANATDPPQSSEAGEIRPSEEPSQFSSTTAVPRSLPLALRYRVLARDHFRCVACGRSPAKDPSIELHVDHILPWSRGGLNVEANLRTLCQKCNLGKGARVDEA